MIIHILLRPIEIASAVDGISRPFPGVKTLPDVRFGVEQSEFFEWGEEVEVDEYSLHSSMNRYQSVRLKGYGVEF